MKNYTKIKIWGKDYTNFLINEDELVVFKLSGEYLYIDYLNDNGSFHRTDGPAIEYHSGARTWWINGKRHRLDGPACEGASGYKSWWVEDKFYTQEDFERKFK